MFIFMLGFMPAQDCGPLNGMDEGPPIPIKGFSVDVLDPDIV
jgi:hypothetical protein